MEELNDVVVSSDAALVEVSPAAQTIPASKAKHAAAQARYKQNRKQAKQAANYVYDSNVEPTKPEAERILEARGILNPRVRATVHKLMLRVAEEKDIYPNRFYFSNGVLKTLASYQQKVPQQLEVILPEDVTGELVNRAELFAIYDCSFAYRDDRSFEEFLKLRRLCKTDAYELGLLLEKDFEECQKNWTEFLPHFEPDSLPARYTQKQMRLWLDSINDIKDYLLLASRNSMKSSFALVWLLTLHLCCPDARALLVSETKKLSAGFVRSYRSYWEVKPHQETALQKLFPEYCLQLGEDAGSTLNFASPMARLDLIQNSVEATSCESVVAGGRSDCLIFDDPISNLSCSTTEQRQKSVDAFDLIQKLREVLGSFSVTIGTPWFDQEDLYAVLLKRNEEDGSGSLAFRVDPIVTLKRSAQHKLTPAFLPSVTEDDIESYLLPVRMPWRFVKKEIASNPSFALSQNFCIFPKSEDAELRVTFEETELRQHTKGMEFFADSPLIETCMGIDTAWSVSRYADRSAIVTVQMRKHHGKNIALVTDLFMDRLKTSQLSEKICEQIERNRPTRILIEKSGDWESLSEAIRRAAMYRNLTLPHFYWKNPSIGGLQHKNKMSRIKNLEPLLANDQLYFLTSAMWNDAIFEEFCKFDGVTKSNSHRKEDCIDALGLTIEAYFPRTLDESPKSFEQRREEDRQEKADRMQAWKNHMFGANPLENKSPTTQEPPLDPRFAQVDKIFGGNGLSGFRRRA